MITGPINNFPTQKEPTSKKDDEWRKKCVNAAETLILYANPGIRKARRQKRINYDLYSDILDQEDVERITNPLGIGGNTSFAKIQNYPICNPKIDLLVGESAKRKFDWRVRVINEDAISDKEEDLKKRFENLVISHIQGNQDEDKVKEELLKFNDFKKFEYQDFRERNATLILKHLWKKQRLEYKFLKGFKDALICAEEIYYADIIASEPVLNRLNPKNVYTMRSGDSPYIEDSDIIVIVGFMNAGAIIDEYHEFLSPDEIDMIERKMIGSSATNSGMGIDIGRKFDHILKIDETLETFSVDNDLGFNSAYDVYGNIRRTIVLWKSMRKVQKLKYYDEQGDEQYEFVDENYKPDKSKGEEVTELWINEWWEGHKIGGSTSGDGAIYCKMRPKPVQFRSMENPSKCYPGVVGTIYNTNDSEAMSLMDRMKPYQYLYDILAYNVELMIAKNKGKIMNLDLAAIPNHWDVDKWLHYAYSMNLAVRDSFKEGSRGHAEGKLAGAMNAQQPVIDMEMGNSIQLYMNMMQYIKQEMGEIAGVSEARQAQISTKEAVSNVEREISQSSHITEYWFMEHDFVKIRALETLLEVAKLAWKDKKNKKVQYVLDNGATEFLQIDDSFWELDHDIAITDGSMSTELLNSLKGLAQAGLQNQMLSFSQLMDIYTTDSLASIRRKIEKAEEDKIQREMQKEQAQVKLNQDNLAANAQEAENQRNFQREEWDREDKRNTENNNIKIQIEQMRQDLANASSNLHTSTGDTKISIDDLKTQLAQLDLEHKKLQEEKRHNIATEEIDKIKAKNSNKKTTK